MPDFVVPAVEGLGVNPIDMAHQQGQIGLPGVQHEVVVVAQDYALVPRVSDEEGAERE